MKTSTSQAAHPSAPDRLCNLRQRPSLPTSRLRFVVPGCTWTPCLVPGERMPSTVPRLGAVARLHRDVTTTLSIVVDIGSGATGWDGSVEVDLLDAGSNVWCIVTAGRTMRCPISFAESRREHLPPNPHPSLYVECFTCTDGSVSNFGEIEKKGHLQTVFDSFDPELLLPEAICAEERERSARQMSRLLTTAEMRAKAAALKESVCTRASFIEGGSVAGRRHGFHGGSKRRH